MRMWSFAAAVVAAIVAVAAIAPAQSTSRAKATVKSVVAEPAVLAGPGKLTLVVTMTVASPFHIYGLKSSESMSLPTSFAIETPDVKIDGPVVEPEPEVKFEGEDKLTYHEGDPAFRIPLSIAEAKPGTTLTIKGKVSFMACDEGGCLAPDSLPISVDVLVSAPGGAATGPAKGAEGAAVDPATAGKIDKIVEAQKDLKARLERIEEIVTPKAPEAPFDRPSWSVADVELAVIGKSRIRAGESIDLTLKFKTPEAVEINAPQDIFADVREKFARGESATSRIRSVDAVSASSSKDGKEHEIRLKLVAADLARSGDASIDLEFDVPMGIKGNEFEMPVTAVDLRLTFGLPNLWTWVLSSVIAALLALLTPCVFPMIPVTVSFFTKQTEKQHLPPFVLPAVYMFGIVASFVIIGVLFTRLLGRDGATFLATNGWLQLAFGLLFVVFSVSLFGIITLTPPAFLMAKAGAVQGKGGILGTLGMGFLFSLTSFTCTAPLVGSLLVFAAESGEWVLPIVGMFAFSAVLGLPFFFLALFPRVLTSMPRSGSWMNVVKVTLGFVELAFALKFIGAADAYFQLGVFTRTTILWIWVVLFAMNALYLLGLIQFAHDRKPEKINPIVGALAVTFLLLALHMVKGTDGRIMPSLIESLLPPDLEHKGEGGVFGWKNRIENDPERAVAIAKDKRAPLLIDFTGYT